MALIWVWVLSAVFGADSLVHEVQTGAGGLRIERYQTPGQPGSHLLQESPRLPSHLLAQTLWVDRNHQFAIVYSLGLDADGSDLVAGWGLNNNRVSHYFTAGDGTPDWNYPKENEIYWAADIMVSMARTAPYLGVTFPGEPVDLLSTGAPTPVVSVDPDPGYVAWRPAISRDGSLWAFVEGSGNAFRVVVYDVSTPTQPQWLWSADLPGDDGGIYGLQFSPDAAVLVVTQYSKIRIFDAQTGNLRGQLPNSSQTETKASNNGEYIVFGNFSGLVQVYHWDGAQYSLAYYYSIGSNVWVTAVDVTPDGQTILAGTFRYSPSYSGSVYYLRMPSAPPPTSLDLRWTYSNYGDYVADVEVSDDGRVLIAGSWGTYGGTYGDVVTILDSTGGVVHAVLDDIDEPGSCFVVDISPDGRFATAGGKAVHAREFGNGGFVYAFRIIDPYSMDVAVSEIQGPQFDLEVGQSTAIAATLTNIGTAATPSFPAIAWITALGSDSLLFGPETVWVNALDPGASFLASFGAWTPEAYGIYQTHFAALLDNDADTSNNTAQRLSICYHDVSTLSILYPFPEITLGYASVPRALVKNHGSYVENFQAFCEIYDPSGSLVYQSQTPVFLLPHQSQEVIFPQSWAPTDSGSYTVKVWVETVDDFRPENDTLPIEVLGTPELLYDDGTAEAFYIVSSTWEGNRFAVRFLPNILGPYTGIRIRTYVNASDPILVSLYPDRLGLPDTAHPFLSVDTLFAPEAPGWAEAVWATTVPEAETLWVVLMWLPYSPSSPGIGADRNDPIDLQSYWFSYSQSWNQWTMHDWMVRLYLNYVVGVEESEHGPPLTFMISAPYPNPTPSGIHFNVEIPRKIPVKIRLYDPAGRKIWSKDLGILPAGSHPVTLHPPVRNGLYFLKVSMGPHERTFKIILRRPGGAQEGK